MNILERLSSELNIRLPQVEAAVKLIDDGNTIPFIARYRKEVTGSLDDTVLRALEERLTALRNLEKRKEEEAAAQAEVEKAVREQEREEQRQQLMKIQEELRRAREEKELQRQKEAAADEEDND